MHRILAILSTANFIAAGALFLLGFLQAGMPVETNMPHAGSAETAMDNSRETERAPPGFRQPPEKDMRGQPQDTVEIEPAANPDPLVQAEDQPRGRAKAATGTATGAGAGVATRAGAGSLLVISQSRDVEQMPGRAGQHLDQAGYPEQAGPGGHIQPAGRPGDASAPGSSGASGSSGAANEVPETLAGDSRNIESAESVPPRAATSNQASISHAAPREEVFIISEDSYSPGSFRLSGENLRRIDAIAQRAARVDHGIVVEGHTDTVPVASNQRASYSNNQELSLLRASVVADRLVARGIDPSRITTRGHGDARPVASNLTPQGRAQNRRVEVRFVPQRRQAAAQTPSSTASAPRQAGD